MIAYIAFGILAILLLLLLRNLYRDAKAKGKGRDFLYRTILWGFLSIVGILILTGRISWLGGVFAIALFVLKWLGSLIINFWPIVVNAVVRFFQMRSYRKNSQTGQRSSSTMTKEQAYKILELKPGASRKEIELAHKKILSKVHPDKGGSNYLTAEVNRARDLLLSQP